MAQNRQASPRPIATPTIAVGIVAHPLRRDMAEGLAAQIEADVVVYDIDGRGERWCHTHTLRRLAATGADWLVLSEDDALPIDDFRPSLARALSDTHPAIVSLYIGQGNWVGLIPRKGSIVERLVAQARRTRASWIDHPRLFHGVAIAIPNAWAAAIIDALEDSVRSSDRTIGEWAIANGRPVRYTWPSLVDHRNGPTLIEGAGERKPNRVAWQVGAWYGPDDEDDDGEPL